MQQVVGSHIVETAGSGGIAVTREHSADYEIDHDPADGAQELRYLHRRVWFVSLFDDRMLAVGFHRRAGRGPDEVGSADAGIPEFTQLRVDVLAHLVEDAIVPSGSRGVGPL